jgi:CubicO group peptidase (beta-lactamase class C family)
MPTGTGFQYSDAGSFLCQLITEKASGMAWWRFVTERLFTRAGITLMVTMDPTAIIRISFRAGEWLLHSLRT